jgi:hypothetical protein
MNRTQLLEVVTPCGGGRGFCSLHESSFIISSVKMKAICTSETSEAFSFHYYAACQMFYIRHRRTLDENDGFIKVLFIDYRGL